MKLHVTEFEFNLDKVVDSAIGKIDVFLLKIIIGIFGGSLKTIINLLFVKGMDLMWILKKLKLDFIGFEKTLMMPMDQYFIFYCTPSFNIPMIQEGM